MAEGTGKGEPFRIQSKGYTNWTELNGWFFFLPKVFDILFSFYEQNKLFSTENVDLNFSKFDQKKNFF